MDTMAQHTNKKQLLKIIVLGESGVGKTSLMKRFVQSRFVRYTTSIAPDFLTKEILVGDVTATLQIWDTAGGERFHSLSMSFFRGADACMLAYDVHRKNTFDALENWRSEALENNQGSHPESMPFICVGNKIDLPDSPAVSQNIVEEWCKQKEMPHFYVSAKEGTNVEQAFSKLASLAIDRSQREPPSDLPPTVDPAPYSETCCVIL
eukprot:Phypoly_transcript_16058.p1 GENE.Phypoly_transcript_16058~~Phypoly_transcript_16058.p1  ORF type:complete len:207 (+),score=27.96 Phypoly_transcript_16058:254-874(+)